MLLFFSSRARPRLATNCIYGFFIAAFTLLTSILFCYATTPFAWSHPKLFISLKKLSMVCLAA